MNDAKKQSLQLGEIVLVILAVLKLLEFWFALSIKSVPVVFFALLMLAVIDTAVIAEYYMHMKRLFASDDEGGH